MEKPLLDEIIISLINYSLNPPNAETWRNKSVLASGHSQGPLSSPMCRATTVASTVTTNDAWSLSIHVETLIAFFSLPSLTHG